MAFDPDAYLASFKPSGVEPSVPVTQTTTGIPGGPADMVSKTGGNPTATSRNNQDLIDLQTQIKRGGNPVQMAAWKDALKLIQSRAGGEGGAPFIEKSSKFDPDAYLASFKAPAAAAKPVAAGPDAIPVEPGANTAITLEQPQSLLSKYIGLQKVIPTLATGAVAGMVAPVAGLAHGLFAGKYGTPEGVRNADAFKDQVQNALTYQPDNALTNEIVGKVGSVASNLVGVPIPTMEALARGATPAARAVKDAGRVAATPITTPLAIRAAEKHVANVADSVKNASRIEAAQKMQELGLVGDPLVMNPTKGNKLKDYVAGSQKVQSAASAHNLEQVPIIAKREMGLPENARLDVANTQVNVFDEARAARAAPYEAVSKMGTLVPDAAVIDELSNLKVSPTFGGKAAAAGANNVIDEAIQAVSAGAVDGASAIRHIRQLRAEAQTTLNSKKMGGMVTPEMEATASVKQGVADAMESLIEANLGSNRKLLDDFRSARTEMAKIYAYENATDFNTGKMDPMEFAKATAKNPRLTGVVADLGHVAGQFPEVFGTPSKAGLAPARIARTSLGGVAGALVGSAVSPGFGTVAGGTIGAGIGQLAGSLLADRLVKPGYQARNAIPRDYRPPANNLRPVEPNVTTNSLVPYDQRNAIAPEGPNWTYGRPDPNVTTSPIPPGAPQLGAPSAESTLQGVQQRRNFDYRMQRTLEQQAAADQAVVSAATRKPASGGVQFDLDPLTGKLVPVDTTLKGATPDILMAGTSHSLDTAAGKVASGQQHLMTAAEKVAWNKTKVDLAAASPEFSSLSDAQVQRKMMDRQWVTTTMVKAREKAAAFDEIAKRANTAQAAREAVASRDRLMDLVESLQEKLSAPRPTRSGVQGKKTREAQRINNLGTAADNVNALID